MSQTLHDHAAELMLNAARDVAHHHVREHLEESTDGPVDGLTVQDVAELISTASMTIEWPDVSDAGTVQVGGALGRLVELIGRERDQARAEVERLRALVRRVIALTRSTDGDELNPDEGIPAGELMRVLYVDESGGEPLAPLQVAGWVRVLPEQGGELLIDETTATVVQPADLPTEYHWGRSWSPTQTEQTCPCITAPCGFIVMDSAPGCPVHGTGQTMKGGHPAGKCPGRPS